MKKNKSTTGENNKYLYFIYSLYEYYSLYHKNLKGGKRFPPGRGFLRRRSGKRENKYKKKGKKKWDKIQQF